MDPNFVAAVLTSAAPQDRDRHPMHLEREMVTYRPARTHPPRSWAVAPRPRIGRLLIATGTHLQGSVLPPGSSPLDNSILGEEAGH
ncbi:MAG TPA: hypothetical protein VGR22_02860 [Thermomicrobiales bacterium]|nr:hypothetical protein [Thermomicrobiales bacterium]